MAQINATNGIGTTALMYAAPGNNLALVKFLLANGAKKEWAEKSGKTALDYAKAYDSPGLIALLK